METNLIVAKLGWRLQLAIRSTHDGIGGSWVDIVVDIEYRMVDIAWKLPKFTTISTFFDCSEINKHMHIPNVSFSGTSSSFIHTNTVNTIQFSV